MTFDEIPNGSLIFVDVNILIYSFWAQDRLSPICYQLLKRIERLEIEAFTTADSISNMVHRLMTIQAIEVYGFAPKSIAHRLKDRLELVQQLEFVN